jgi:hypothetical protein
VWKLLDRWFAKKRVEDVGSYRECGSYYPPVTYADELWDHDYLEACRELDAEFPNARLLPAGSWSLGLSEAMLQSFSRKVEQENEEWFKNAVKPAMTDDDERWH